IEIMEDVVGMDVGEGRALPPTGHVGMAVGALGPLPDHEIGLPAAIRRTEEDQGQNEERRQLVQDAHSLTHWTMAWISSGVRHCARESTGGPGQPCGMRTPAATGPWIFWTR